jgi:hypothetical protein
MALMHIDRQPIRKIIDTAFKAAAFLDGKDASTIWNAFCAALIPRVYREIPNESKQIPALFSRRISLNYVALRTESVAIYRY